MPSPALRKGWRREQVKDYKVGLRTYLPCLVLMSCRKMILCALARHDHAAARKAFSKMSETGRNDRITRYLMYKVGLHEGDADFGRPS
jgi:hypothetical protein